MTRIVYDIRNRCKAPGCQEYATKRVNLKGFVAYMAMDVCEGHVDWAEQDLEQYMPTDR